MRKSSASAALVALLSLTAGSAAYAADGTVSTFHSVGITWSPAGGSPSAAAQVQFRPQGSTAFRRGLDLWFDSRNGEYRGSLVGLVPGTTYEVELALAGTSTKTTMTAATWNENVPIAKTITLPATSSATLEITESGSPSGYILYTAAPGQSAAIDVANGQDYDVAIRGAYVIVRGLKLEGATHHAIRIFEGAHDVFIEDNDISGFGSVRDTAHGWGTNEDSGVFVGNGPTVDRIVIQRNRIHDARWDTNSWSFGHPAGPQGVTFETAGGNHVIRYNEILGSDQKHWEDCIGGGENFSNDGFPNRDSDVYGNICTYAWDDAIELEGGDRNVRAWGNFLDYTGTGIASATTGIGPLYVFRNVYLHSHKLSEVSLDEDDRGPFAKTGDGGGFGGGRRYFFHNTVLQPPPSGGAKYSLGAGAGIGDDGGPMTNVVSRNNIWQNFKDWHSSIQDTRASATNDFDYDLENGTLETYSGAEPHGMKGVPVYAPGNGAASGNGGNYALAATSPGFDHGTAIPNFNDEFTGAAPDVGAHESGAPAMVFGIAAASASATPIAGTPPSPAAAGGSGTSPPATSAPASGGGNVPSPGRANGSAAADDDSEGGCRIATGHTHDGPAMGLLTAIAIAFRTSRRRRALLPGCQARGARAPRV